MLGIGAYLKLAAVFAIVSALAGAALYVKGLKDDLEVARANAAIAEDAARRNAEAAAASKAHADKVTATMAKERDAAAARAVRNAKTRVEVVHAAKNECPVDPAVAAAAGSLWGNQAPAQSGDAAPGGAGEPVDLRTTTGPAPR